MLSKEDLLREFANCGIDIPETATISQLRQLYHSLAGEGRASLPTQALGVESSSSQGAPGEAAILNATVNDDAAAILCIGNRVACATLEVKDSSTAHMEPEADAESMCSRPTDRPATPVTPCFVPDAQTTADAVMAANENQLRLLQQQLKLMELQQKVDLLEQPRTTSARIQDCE
uniref:Uncharacterized protein n=1 Tax=Anopheles atroparvus TaxID=41427 RepID=A0A182JK14_ANOAO